MPDTIDEDVSEQEEPTYYNESDDSAARFSDYIISTGESTERSDEDTADNTSSRSQQETAVTTPTTSLVLVRVLREVKKIRLTTVFQKSTGNRSDYPDYIISTGESTERSDEDTADNTSSRSQQATAVTTPTTSLVLVRVLREVMKIRPTTHLPEVNRQPQ